MHSYDVLGYTYGASVICLACSDEIVERDGYPIFVDSEWDSYPTCDRCSEAIEDVALTSDGIEWLHSIGRKLWWESENDESEESEE